MTGGIMKFKVFHFGMTLSIVWAAIVFLSGLANLIWSNYGIAFLKLIDSIYPGYQLGKWGFGGVIVGALYAAIDALIIGIVFACLYNFLTRKEHL